MLFVISTTNSGDRAVIPPQFKIGPVKKCNNFLVIVDIYKNKKTDTKIQMFNRKTGYRSQSWKKNKTLKFVSRHDIDITYTHTYGMDPRLCTAVVGTHQDTRETRKLQHTDITTQTFEGAVGGLKLHHVRVGPLLVCSLLKQSHSVSQHMLEAI